MATAVDGGEQPLQAPAAAAADPDAHYLEILQVGGHSYPDPSQVLKAFTKSVFKNQFYFQEELCFILRCLSPLHVADYLCSISNFEFGCQSRVFIL